MAPCGALVEVLAKPGSEGVAEGWNGCVWSSGAAVEASLVARLSRMMRETSRVMLLALEGVSESHNGR